MLHMRTTLDLEDRLLESLAARHPGVPRTEAIERAVRAYLEADSTRRLLELAGSFPIESVVKELRANDTTS
jgi:metal-responsive CopG/Arc/MetJ family transcriptional regulator